jgi:hypothetical protein
VSRDGDGFFSSDMFLLVIGLIAFVVLLQVGVVGQIGEWLGNLMVGGVKGP